MSEPLRHIALVADESDLVAAFRARLEEINVSRAELDAELDLPGGYTSKRLTLPKQMKYYGRDAFWNTAEALGLAVLLVEDPAAKARYAARMKRRSKPQAVTGSEHWRGKRVEAELRQRIYKIASTGGIARAAALSPERRACIASRAAKARHRKARQAKKKMAKLANEIRWNAVKAAAKGETK